MARETDDADAAQRDLTHWTAQLEQLEKDKLFVHGLLLLGVVGAPAAYHFLGWVWALAAVGCTFILWGSSLYMVLVRRYEFRDNRDRAAKRLGELEPQD